MTNDQGVLKEPPASAHTPRGILAVALVLSAVTLLLSVTTAVQQWRSGSELARTSATVDETLDARCDAYDSRLRIAPETALERAMRQQAVDRYSKACALAP